MSGLNLLQFHLYITIPALKGIGLFSPEAAQLVTGTALAESGLVFVDQVTNGPERPGPAYGLFQMEARTYHDHWDRWLVTQKKELAAKLERLILPVPGIMGIDQLHGNHYYAAAMCRVHYLRAPAKLPGWNDLEGQARYWKEFYNTKYGKGTVEGYMKKAAAVLTLPKE